MKHLRNLAALAGLALGTSAFATVTVDTGFAASNTSNAIPDANFSGLIIPLAVGPDAINGDTIFSVSLSLILSHTWQGDVVVNLRSPTGNVLNILSRPGVTGPTSFGWNPDNFGSPGTGALMNFIDGAPRVYDLPVLSGVTNIPNPVGDWLPFAGTGGSVGAGPLAAIPLGNLASFGGFAGENAVGTWTVEIFDTANDDVGFANQVVLNIVTVPTPGVLVLLGMGGLAATRRRRA
jgi:hypothetical protein